MNKTLTHYVSRTLPTLSRQFLISALLSGSAFFASALAQAAPTTIPVDLSSATVTKNEIALLQVLSEVCPRMLNSQQTNHFYKFYNSQLKEMLPSVPNPKLALQYLSTQQDYKNVLSETRDWTMGFSREENLALCMQMAEATSK